MGRQSKNNEEKKVSLPWLNPSTVSLKIKKKSALKLSSPGLLLLLLGKIFFDCFYASISLGIVGLFKLFI